MKRIWRISEFTQTVQKCRKIPFNTHKLITKPLIPIQFIRHYSAQSPGIDDAKQSTLPDIISLFSDKWSYNLAETKLKRDLIEQVSKLKDEILSQNDDLEKIEQVLDGNGVALFRRYSDGSAMVELLTQLKHLPNLAMEVFSWRRKQLDYAAPMTVEEYAKGISMAGRLKNVDLAIELFNEASNKQLKATSLYNALMSAYMYEGSVSECHSLFKALKSEQTCTPSIITYNILISAFGRLMCEHRMEETFNDIKDSKLAPTLSTYKGLIGGYVTAWNWEKMEKTYLTMKADGIKPNVDIHLLMLRGYAISCNLEKMEEMYDVVKDHVGRKESPLLGAMIRAYCKSSDLVDKVEKIERLLRLIPENEYQPSLNVVLIRLYAEEDLLEEMENSINEAFERNTCVTTVSIMRCIISSYFRQNEVDKLALFVERAEGAGWKICRSLYHCKMVMYSSQRRLYEMERVLDEMYRVHIHLSKKTFWILVKAYRKWGERSKLDQVVGMMCKHGYEVPLDGCDS